MTKNVAGILPTAVRETPATNLIESGGHKVIDSPTDEELPSVLAALIDALASVNVFVRFTDHLSDRELYEYLVDEERLGAHMALLPNNFIFSPCPRRRKCH